MPGKCCVPRCKTNYDSTIKNSGEVLSTFGFPKDPQRRDFWLSMIPGMSDRCVTQWTRVCKKHFLDKFLSMKHHDNDGSKSKRRLMKLSDNAYPTIFPNASKAELSLNQNGVQRPEILMDEVHNETKTEIDNWVATDKIKDFPSFCKEAESYLDFAGDKWICELDKDQEIESIRFSMLQDTPVSPDETSHESFVPVPLFTITVFADMHLKMHSKISGVVPESSMSWIFGNQSPPLLVYWSQFVTILCQCSIGFWIDHNDFDSSICINDLHELPPLEKEDQANHLSAEDTGNVGETFSIHTTEITDATVDENINVKLKDEILQLTLKLHSAIYQRNLLMKKMKIIQDLASINLDIVSLSLIMNSEGKEEMGKVHRLVQTIMKHAEEMNAGLQNVPVWMKDNYELSEKDDFLKVKFPSFQDNSPPLNDCEEMDGKHPESNGDSYVDGQSLVEGSSGGNFEVNDGSVDDRETSMESSQHVDDNGEGLTCEHCQDGRRFANLQLHRRIAHNIKLQTQCQICGKQCKSHTKLLLHMMTHSDERPFQCAQCGSRFKCKSSLNKHEKTFHSEERPHICSICGTGFKHHDHLMSHIPTHTRTDKIKRWEACKGTDNLYQCNVCDKRFRNLNALKWHLAHHSDVRPCRCIVCGKTFKWYSALQKHLLDHKDERRYECLLCGMKFKKKDRLASHQTVHTDHREFECDICRKRFKTRKCLRDHRYRHKQCSLCLQIFKHKKDLAAHEKKAHTIDNRSI